MSKKRTITLSIIGICLIITLMIGISYSLWTIKISQENPNNVLADCFNITFTENNNILLDNTFPMYDEDGKKLEPYTFTIKNNCASYADYQVQLEITNSSTLDEQYLKIMLNENTPSLMNTLEVGEPQETNMKKAYILDKGALDKNEEKTYNLRIWLDENVTTETEGVQNSTWSAKVTINARYIDKLPTYCDSNPNAGACEILAKGETEELKFDNTVDNNLRYVGANPNNYVSFNNELWRIIGVMNNIDDGTGKKETRLKIIRNESIGTYSWDNKASGVGSSISDKGSNDWSDSALQIVLNEGAYWNRTSGECPYGSNGATTPCYFSNNGLTNDAKQMIGNTLWNLGGASNYASVYDGLASYWYTYERGTTVFGGHATEWIGKIGLMYPSDYGYATSGGATTNREACLNKSLNYWQSVSDCYNNDWLYNSSKLQWSMTSSSSFSYYVFIVYSSGSVLEYSGNERTINLLPTLYLSSNVKISGGEGTESNPYTLSL